MQKAGRVGRGRAGGKWSATHPLSFFQANLLWCVLFICLFVCSKPFLINQMVLLTLKKHLLSPFPGLWSYRMPCRVFYHPRYSLVANKIGTDPSKPNVFKINPRICRIGISESEIYQNFTVEHAPRIPFGACDTLLWPPFSLCASASPDATVERTGIRVFKQEEMLGLQQRMRRENSESLVLWLFQRQRPPQWFRDCRTRDQLLRYMVL